MSVLWEKILLIKYTIQFVEENAESAYEDLLEFIENTTPTDRVKPFTEESLLRHAQFIVDQVCGAAAGGRDHLVLVLWMRLTCHWFILLFSILP